MLISEAIQKSKDFCGGLDLFGSKGPINAVRTRDQVLYGSVDQKLTGIVTCIWPTADVIREAMRIGANLIISHEALFWNHGDRMGFLAFNKTFQAKKVLLDKWGGAVWRNHDYIHSQVPIDDGRMVDGIFYGLARKLGWLDYRVGDTSMPMDFEIPATPARELADLIVCKLGLNGTRIIGDPDALVRRIHIPMHIIGPDDDAELMKAEEGGFDCLVTMELTDFTLQEYIRDSAMLGRGKCIITLGHFNTEEPGMEYMAEWLPGVLGEDIPVTFVPMRDPFIYVLSR
mgnify:CR=1 FL=1